MVIAKDAVYILTVPSAMDRQMGVLPTADAPLVKDLMLRLSSDAEATDKAAMTRSACIQWPRPASAMLCCAVLCCACLCFSVLFCAVLVCAETYNM